MIYLQLTNLLITPSKSFHGFEICNGARSSDHYSAGTARLSTQDYAGITLHLKAYLVIQQANIGQ